MGVGLLTRLASTVTGDDALVLMNIIQFLPLIVGSVEGARFVVDAGILARLLALAGVADASATATAVATAAGDGVTEPDPFVGVEAADAVGELYKACYLKDAALRGSLHDSVVPGLLKTAATVLAECVRCSPVSQLLCPNVHGLLSRHVVMDV